MNHQRKPREATIDPVLRMARSVVFAMAWIAVAIPVSASAQSSGGSTPCRIESTTFEGWWAEQLSNRWVKLTIVPQLGGRLMQVTFDSHPYLFVNPKYKGQYFPPAEGADKGRWFNYGGDKIWPMPEGRQDEHHWPGPISDMLDDGTYVLKRLSESPRCTVRLDGPPDPKTGLEYSREISIRSDSPEIKFHAIMKNSSGHPIQWSMQSVTQYDTNDPQNPDSYNREFWAFTPANPHSKYLDRYHVRSGLADDPSYSVKDDLFRLHWLPIQNEVWLDSTGGWLAVVNSMAHYAMVERFQYHAGAEYPGEATVIFYKNGAALGLDDQGNPRLNSSDPDDPLRYMEAEINSPIVKLEPGASYSMDTDWFPVRMGNELSAVTTAGVMGTPFKATQSVQGILLTGSCGVFVPGTLEARLYDNRGEKIAVVPLQKVSPEDSVDLHQEIKAPRTTVRASIHLIDRQGNDRGPLGDAKVTPMDRSS